MQRRISSFRNLTLWQWPKPGALWWPSLLWRPKSSTALLLRDCSLGFQEGVILAEELVRLNDPFTRWLAGCPFTHSLTESWLRVSCVLGTMQSSGGAKGRQLQFQGVLTLARNTDPVQQGQMRGTEGGVYWQLHWKERPLKRQELGVGKSFQVLSPGRGTQGNSVKAKSGIHRWWTEEQERDPGGAQGRAQDRTEPASNPTPSLQRWRNWGLGRIP